MFKKQVLTLVLTVALFISILPTHTTALTSQFSHSDSYLNSEYYKKLIAVSLGNDSATNIVNIAKSQLGYHEGNRSSDMDGTNPTGNADFCEYNHNIHSGANLPWCTSFVSWCAIQAGEGKAIPKKGSTGDIYSYVLEAGGEKIAANEVKAGDLVFYKVTSSGSFCHVGIMTSATTSIEGNYSNAVKSCKPASYVGTYGNTVANGKITVLYLRPAYSKTAPQIPPISISVRTDKSEYTLGESVSITATAENASEFSLKIIRDADDRTVYETDIVLKNTKAYTPILPGNYTVSAVAKNSVESASASCTFTVIEPAENTFIDISEKAYYANAVKWASENEITNGTGKYTFSPDDVCTRAQAATFLWRASGSPMPQNTIVSFDDVAPDKYYFEAVQWAFEQGITDGTSAISFSPNAECTRAHIVTFIYRMHNARSESTGTPFVDVSENAYYADAVSWAVSEGITNGSSHTAFSPNDGCTRAQIVTFLYRDIA